MMLRAPASRDVPLAPQTGSDADAPPSSWRTKCLNCDAAITGQFCAACGQRALPPHPTVRELAGDAFSEFSGWDGKFAETVRLLFTKPGELTRQWLAGRRVHFISPVRLYFTASLLYFVVSAAAPNLRSSDGNISAGVDVGVTPSRPERVAERARESLNGGVLTGSELEEARRDVAKAPWIMRPMLTKMIDDPNAMKAGMLRWAPRMLVALLPAYAAILALFYRKRNYPEHLYFAIHLHSFVFAALTLANLFKFSHAFVIATITGLGGLAWIVVYSLMALRRVYGGTAGGTLARATGIMTLYSVVALPALLGVVLLSVF